MIHRVRAPLNRKGLALARQPLPMLGKTGLEQLEGILRRNFHEDWERHSRIQVRAQPLADLVRLAIASQSLYRLVGYEGSCLGILVRLRRASPLGTIVRTRATSSGSTPDGPAT